MICFIKLAGKIICAEVKYTSTVEQCSRFLTSVQAKPDLHINIDQSDIDYQWKLDPAYDNIVQSPMCKAYEPRLEREALFRKIVDYLFSLSIFPMHGTVVSDGVISCMFTAPSGTGKTTRAKLFVDNHPETFILNGDKPLLRIESDHLVACGSPWNGKEGYGINAEATLKAIFFLERAENTTVTEISLEEALVSILNEIYIPSRQNGTKEALRLILAMNGKVRLFRYRSAPNLESVEMAWNFAKV